MTADTSNQTRSEDQSELATDHLIAFYQMRGIRYRHHQPNYDGNYEDLVDALISDL